MYLSFDSHLKAETIPATTILNPKPPLRWEFSCGRNLALSHFFESFIVKRWFVLRTGPMSQLGVRRAKAALSSGCKSHPANAPAGSNRSSHGGNEVAEAFD
jgi:hypothetical protein